MWGLPEILEFIATKIGPLLAGPVSQFVTGINFTQIFTTIKANVQKYWKVYAIAALIGLQGVTAYGWSHDHKAFVAEKASHQADISSYKQAQKDAQAKADAERHQLQQEGKVKADAADKSYSTLFAQYRTNLLRFKANQSAILQSGNSELPSAQSGNGPSDSSDVPATMIISTKDAETCAVNTARLVVVHDWAVGLAPTDGQ